MSILSMLFARVIQKDELILKLEFEFKQSNETKNQQISNLESDLKQCQIDLFDK